MSEEQDTCIFFENRELFSNSQVPSLVTATFYYDRVGMRCYPSDDNGLSNTEYALSESLKAHNVFGLNHTTKMLEAGLVKVQPSEVVKTFLNATVFEKIFSTASPAFQNYTEFLLAIDRVQGVCAG